MDAGEGGRLSPHGGTDRTVPPPSFGRLAVPGPATAGRAIDAAIAVEAARRGITR